MLYLENFRKETGRKWEKNQAITSRLLKNYKNEILRIKYYAKIAVKIEERKKHSWVNVSQRKNSCWKSSFRVLIFLSSSL